MYSEEPVSRRRSWTTIVSNVPRDALVIWRRDGWLIAGLIVAALIGFQGSVRRAFEIARQVEVAYGLALLPALFVLSGLLLFHEYGKRQEIKTAAAAAAAEAAQVRERLLELEHLAALGQALACCLTFDGLQQVVWKHLPRLLGEHDAWVLTYTGSAWQVLADTSGVGAERLEFLQPQATNALSQGAEACLRPEGTDHNGTVCFPMIVGGRVVGVLGLPDASGAGGSRRRMMAAAATLLAIAVRNVQLFLDIRDNALHDSLTGCLVRAHGVEALAREIDRLARKTVPLSILMFDLDHFKTINDRYGHLVGDQVLAAVGERIRRVLRRSDIKCRYGGDEFLIILPETSAEGAVQVAQWLHEGLSAVSVPGLAPEAAALGVSFGTATTERVLEVNELLGRADAALYQAKDGGRNCVRSYSLPAVASDGQLHALLDEGLLAPSPLLTPTPAACLDQGRPPSLGLAAAWRVDVPAGDVSPAGSSQARSS
jgi:diguanylate cyclase (GGDEF)-like protein